jgi:DNA polymerase III delta prime subunit
LSFIAEGDMRNAINNLQAVYVATKEIIERNIYRICDVPEK